MTDVITMQLQANLANIEAAIASGVTRASYDGKSTEFRSLAEMRSIRDSLRSQLGMPVRSRRTVAGYSSGIGGGCYSGTDHWRR